MLRALHELQSAIDDRLRSDLGRRYDRRKAQSAGTDKLTVTFILRADTHADAIRSAGLAAGTLAKLITDTAPPSTCPASCSSSRSVAGWDGTLRLLGYKPVAVDDRCGEVEELAVGGAGLVAQHVEGGRIVDEVAHHRDALGCSMMARRPNPPSS